MANKRQKEKCIKCGFPPVQPINNICWFCRHEADLETWKTSNLSNWKCPKCSYEFHLFSDLDLEKLYKEKNYDSIRICPQCKNPVNK